MIRDRLIPEIQKAFTGWEMIINPNENPIARFSGIQNDVGDVVIYDDGDEVTVCIEGITHGHFDPCDRTVGATEQEKDVTEDVIDFLKALFADKVLLHVSADKRIGGWSRLDYQDGPFELSNNYRYYLWSKPYNPQTANRVGGRF